MRILFTVFCLALTLLSLGQDKKETHGKTHAHILNMGFDKWYEFYTKKEGETTHGMSQACYIYARSLKWRNQGLEAKANPHLRQQVKELRSHFSKLGESAVTLFSTLSGGGTMWLLTYATDAMDQEKTLYALLNGKVKPAKARVVSDVTKEIDSLSKAIATAPESTWREPSSKANANRQLKIVQVAWQDILAIAKKLDRKKSDHVLAYCATVLQASVQDVR